jgi:7-carboxy-7-deazaguanine synthase
VGLSTVFVRLTGCPLRCGYCDTAYAFHGGATLTLKQILSEVSRYRTRYVTVTGGEPLAQKNCPALLTELADRGYSVSLETGGALDVSQVGHLTARDEIKFVLCNETDYEWAKRVLAERGLDRICPVLFSPSHHDLPAPTLAAWILRDALPVRMQVQLHKQLWGEARGR